MTTKALSSALSSFSPENDTVLFKNYGKSNIKVKTANKLEMQKAYGLEQGANIFALGITGEILEKQRGNDCVEVIKALLEIEVQVVVCASFEAKYQKIFHLFQKEHPKHFCLLDYSDENVRKTHAAVDSELFLSYSASTESLLAEAMRYGVVPVSVFHESLENFNAVEETGNAFLIKEVTLWRVFETCIRAKENFSFPYDWKNIQLACMGE